MPYDEGLAQRIREILEDYRGITEKKMFGGMAFMFNGNMLCGIIGEEFIARLGTSDYEIYLKKAHTRKFDFTGKPMKGFVVVSPKGYEDDSDLSFWVKTCISFATSLPSK
jgi:TfoX/Sxy family transcriptional regulator of competence genes